MSHLTALLAEAKREEVLILNDACVVAQATYRVGGFPDVGVKITSQSGLA
jgi:hypothetical protein